MTINVGYSTVCLPQETEHTSVQPDAMNADPHSLQSALKPMYYYGCPATHSVLQSRKIVTSVAMSDLQGLQPIHVPPVNVHCSAYTLLTDAKSECSR
jgi:hypothetical protein